MSFKEIKKMLDEILYDISRINDANKRSFKREIDKESMKGIIDISLDEEREIPKEKFESSIVKDYRYRILKLDRPYKRSSMSLSQLNSETLKMYASLCNELESELNKKGTSVARLVSSLRRSSSYYDIYYTIYKIAESHVINFYNPLSDISISRSFEILEDVTNKEIKNIIKIKAKELTKDLKEADEETRSYFKLTDNNKKSVWRDAEGKLREKYNITRKEEIAIDQISKRNNVLRKNEKVTEILLDMYLGSLKGSFDNENIDTINIITRTSPYTFSKNALDSLLIFSESNVRNKFNFFTKINTADAVEVLENVDYGKFFDYIENYQEDFLNDLSFEVVDDIYEDYFRENPTKYKDRIAYIKSFDISNQIEILNKIKNTDGFNKIINLLLKDEFEEMKVMALYFIYKKDLNSDKSNNVLFKIIREENYPEFIDLISNNDLTIDLIDKIMDLKNPKVKRINMDSKKLEKSRVELKETVDIVSQFFDDEKDYEDNDEEIIENVDKEDKTYEDILSKILNNKFISIDQISEIAINEGLTTNTYISKINDYLFDYIGDQTLLIKDDKVIIDEFYIEMIEEMLDEN